MFQTIYSMDDYYQAIRTAGFMTAGGNAEGIFSLRPYWGENLCQFSGDPCIDPWMWRIRMIGPDLAYGKVFFKKSGWITREWYPYFVAIRRQGQGIESMYEDGLVSQMERRIYRAVADKGQLAVHEIKAVLRIGKEERARFESALVSLQDRLWITVCGEVQKQSAVGKPYGWHVNVYCQSERYFGVESFEPMDAQAAKEAVQQRILEINPHATKRDMERFIGRGC